MEQFSVTQWFATAIDYWWAWALPVAIMFVLRNYIKNGWIRIRLRASDSPYANIGNEVQFVEGGTKWKLWKITMNNVYLEIVVKGNGDFEMMRMPIDKYWNSTIIYKKI